MKPIDDRRIRSLVMAVALSIGLGLVTHASAERSYLIDLETKTSTDLGDLQATALNDAGQVVGNSGGHSFITGPNGVGRTDLGTLPGGDRSIAYGINDVGQVVGYSDIGGGFGHAFITGPNGGGMTDLGTLRYDFSYAHDINDAGRVAGGSLNDPTYGAFITGPNGAGMTDIGTLGGTESTAHGINDAGQVVGDSSIAGHSPNHAFITGPNGVGMTDLGTLGGKSSLAFVINDAGQVAGWAYTATGAQHAFITSPNGVGMRDLGTLPGGDRSIAYGISDVGQVVGYSSIAGHSPNQAFITGLNGMGMTDLNSLVHLPGGLVMDNAVAINNMGQVLVSAHPVIPAVPEPESYALMLAGLVLTGFMARRKQKADAREGRILGL